MMLSERVHRVMFPLGREVCFMCFLWGGERPQEKATPTDFDLGLVAARAGQSRAQKARAAIASDVPLVLAILGGRYVTQVAKAVVVSDSVDVVNVTRRPNAVNVKPRKAMFLVLPPKQANLSVALRLANPSGASACFGKLVACRAANEVSRFGIVMQKLFQSSLRKCISGFSHVIAPYQRCFGQRIEGVCSTFFPRSNIGELV